MPWIGRGVRAAVNPASTAVTRWWCYSALRHLLTGYGPAASQRRLTAGQRQRTRQGLNQSDYRTPSAGQMEAREAAIGQLLKRDHGMWQSWRGLPCGLPSL